MHAIRRRLVIFLGILLFGVTGCAGSVLNPYENEFMCPNGFPGECASVKTAYKKSFVPSESESFSPMVKTKTAEPGNAAAQKEEYTYKGELYKELAGLIKDPVTPVLVPSKQMRVLIPGYSEKGLYYSYRYIYFIARQPQWMLPTVSQADPGEFE